MANGAALPLTGSRAVIQWYYQTAADVRDYAVRFDQDTRAWTVRGGVVAPNAYALQQSPLTFAITVKGGPALRWPVVRVTIADGRLVALLGSPGSDL